MSTIKECNNNPTTSISKKELYKMLPTSKCLECNICIVPIKKEHIHNMVWYVYECECGERWRTTMVRIGHDPYMDIGK